MLYFDPTLNKFSVCFQHCFKQNWKFFLVLFLLGFQPDEEMSEVFKTEFQNEIALGSKGAHKSIRQRDTKNSIRF